VISIVLPDGEEYKNWASLMQIFDALLANKATARPRWWRWAAA
jgi:3-dehydroquinate synthetase